MFGSSFYRKRQINLPFPIVPPGDAHDFCKEISAFARSKNRRSERQKENIFVVRYKLLKMKFDSAGYIYSMQGNKDEKVSIDY